MSPTSETPTTGDLGPELLPRSGERRRLLRRSLAAGPVLMTVASRPVLGAVTCTTASAFASGNESSPGQVLPTCSGSSPTTWKNTPPGQLPSPYGGSTNFLSSTTGLVAGTTGSTYDQKLTAILGLSDTGGTQSLALYIAAALLNAANGSTPVLGTTTVRAMWNDFVTAGSYQPIPGINWGADQIVTYIKSTIG